MIVSITSSSNLAEILQTVQTVQEQNDAEALSRFNENLAKRTSETGFGPALAYSDSGVKHFLQTQEAHAQNLEALKALQEKHLAKNANPIQWRRDSQTNGRVIESQAQLAQGLHRHREAVVKAFRSIDEQKASLDAPDTQPSSKTTIPKPPIPPPPTPDNAQEKQCFDSVDDLSNRVSYKKLMSASEDTQGTGAIVQYGHFRATPFEFVHIFGNVVYKSDKPSRGNLELHGLEISISADGSVTLTPSAENTFIGYKVIWLGPVADIAGNHDEHPILVPAPEGVGTLVQEGREPLYLVVETVDLPTATITFQQVPGEDSDTGSFFELFNIVIAFETLRAIITTSILWISLMLIVVRHYTGSVQNAQNRLQEADRADDIPKKCYELAQERSKEALKKSPIPEAVDFVAIISFCEEFYPALIEQENALQAFLERNQCPLSMGFPTNPVELFDGLTVDASSFRSFVAQGAVRNGVMSGPTTRILVPALVISPLAYRNYLAEECKFWIGELASKIKPGKIKKKTPDGKRVAQIVERYRK